MQMIPAFYANMTGFATLFWQKVDLKFGNPVNKELPIDYPFGLFLFQKM